MVGRSVEHDEAGCARSGDDHVGPTIAIQITSRHAVNRTFAITERKGLELLAGAVVEICDAGSVDITDQQFRTVIAIEIGGDHGVR